MGGGINFRIEPYYTPYCILQQNSKNWIIVFSGVELCGVEWGVGAYKSRFSKYTWNRQLYRGIQRNTWKIDILNVNSGFVWHTAENYDTGTTSGAGDKYEVWTISIRSKPQRWIITIPSFDQWLPTIEYNCTETKTTDHSIVLKNWPLFWSYLWALEV